MEKYVTEREREMSFERASRLPFGFLISIAGIVCLAAPLLSAPQLKMHEPHVREGSVSSSSTLPQSCQAAANLKTDRELSGKDFLSLGISYQKRNRPECASAAFATAIKLDPSLWLAHLQLGDMLARAGDLPRAAAELKIAVRQKSDSPEIRNALGIVLQDSGDPLGAAQQFRASLQLNPKLPEAWLGLGQALASQKKYVFAIRDFQRGLTCNPSQKLSIRLQLGVSSAYVANGETEKAGKILRSLAAHYPDSAEVHVQLGNLQATGRDFSSAAEQYSQALRINSKHQEARLSLAKALDMMGKYEEAMPVIQPYVQSWPDDAEGYYVLGRTYQGLGKFPAAAKAFRRAVQLKPRQFMFHYYLGFVLERAGESAEAMKEYEIAERIDPTASQVHYGLYRLLQKSGQRDRAKQELQKFNRLTEQANQKSKAEVLAVQARNFLAAGDASKAAAAYRQAVSLYPNGAKIRYNLSIALSALKDHDGERRELNKVIEIDPDYAPAHNQLALLDMDTGQLSAAEHEFRLAISADPQFAKAQNSLGVLLSREGKISEAISLFQQATESDPGLAEAHLNLGVLLAEQGQNAEARKQLQQAIRLHPGLRQAEEVLKMLDAQGKK